MSEQFKVKFGDTRSNGFAREVAVERGMTVAMLINNETGESIREIHGIITVNGNIATESQQLMPGDMVSVASRDVKGA